MVGAQPRVANPVPGGPSRFISCDWQDAVTHLRADDRSGEGVVGIVMEEKRTLASLPQLRSVKAVDPLALDPSIAAITGGISDPNAAQGRPDAGKPKKKK